MEKNIFEIAAKDKYRFNFKGVILAEDLFDLKLTDLDAVYKSLNAQAKLAEEESLLTIKTAQNEELATKIEIVKYIVSVKLAEQNARLEAAAMREKKQKIIGILADKQDAELLNKSPEELQKMLEELGE